MTAMNSDNTHPDSHASDGTAYRNFARRRARLMDEMAARGGGVAIHLAAPLRMRNRDTEYPYRFDSHFWYLSGFPEPAAALALVVHGQRRESILFCRAREPEREVWEGMRYGPEQAQSVFGFDRAHNIEQLDEIAPDLLADAPALYFSFESELSGRAERWLAVVRGRARAGTQAPGSVHDLLALVDTMRLVKDDSEIETMRRAARISALAHARAMRACRPGLREYELEAELLHEFRRHGAQSPAYGSIVAAGANACVLHYPAGDGVLADGELCLIDAGCEVDGYASDVTRTFPVSGSFGGEQRAVYEIVLAAQLAAIEAVRPGATFNAPHEAALRVLVQGLIDLQLLAGSLDGALESGSYRQFYMHRTGHWLGLDVHDVGDYRSGTTPATGQRGWRQLAPGMALTVEPGLYLRAADNVPARLQGIGIRIEDDVVVTPSGCEVLSAEAPRTIADIEALMRSASKR